MRTKTLILSALAGAFCSASLMAQVYSLNSVGYINVTCPPGFSMIANQLNTGTNVISPNLFDAQMTANSASFNGCVIWKFVPGTGAGTGWQQYVFNTGFAAFGGPPWSNPNATITTMNPGEGAFFQNINNTNVTLTFVGTVLTGSPVGLPVKVLPGFNVISSQVPLAGAADNTLGLTNVLNNGDSVYVYSNGWSQFEYNTGFAGFGGAPWNTGVAPNINVGQSFFYLNNTSTTNSWTTSFSVN
jgi:hypothetical protein